MKVELLSHTPDALNLLLSTKGTRLHFDANPVEMTDEERGAHLAYMLGTIKSSWEFVDYTFRISGVTRAFTHQLVRTRTGSYAQEAQRVVDVRSAEVIHPKLTPAAQDVWDAAIDAVKESYSILVDAGYAVQDARGLLPTNITTSIVAKFNLRTLHETAKLRLCTRTQGEYQTVFRAMRDLVLGVHPWADPFIQVHCVSTGTCAFPHYGPDKCKFYDPRMNNTALKTELKDRFWADEELQEANPVATKGMAT
jgi:flavin-dependent thymidylate synthase